MEFNICIILPIYNRLKTTIRGLNSIYDSLDVFSKQSNNMNFRYQIIVVDDGSTDGSSQYIKENYGEIILLQGNGNLWWTGSIDKGCRYAVNEKGVDFVLLWNDDTICELNYFTNLSNFLELNIGLHSSIIVSKIKFLDNQDTIFNFGCTYNRKNGKKKAIGIFKSDNDSEFNSITQIDWSGGMGTLIPSKILKDIDFFDFVNFPHYHGDSDMFLRAQNRGWLAYAIPSLIVYNDMDLTGINQARNFKELYYLLTSYRSSHHFVQNFKFNKRHSNTAISYYYFLHTYFKLILSPLKYSIKRIIHTNIIKK